MPMFRALKNTRYSTRRLQAGDTVEITNRRDMRTMTAIGAVELVNSDEPAVPVAVRRGRGRPRKHPLPAGGQPQPRPTPQPRPVPAPPPPPTEAQQSGPVPVSAPEPERELIEPRISAAEGDAAGTSGGSPDR